MRDCPFRSLTFLCLGLLLSAQGAVRAEMSGSAGRATTYQGTLMLPSGERCDVSIPIERVSFFMATVVNKYRFVRVLVDCRQNARLLLSSSADRVEVATNQGAAQGVLSLQRSDSALWDSLDAALRQTLAYPSEIKPGEPVYLFVYFPIGQITTMPREFSYTIASLKQTVTLRVLATAARS